MQVLQIDAAGGNYSLIIIMNIIKNEFPFFNELQMYGLEHRHS